MPVALLTNGHPVLAADRPVTLQVGATQRMFNQELGLDSGLGADVRVGLGLSDRASLALDFLYTPTQRSVTDRFAIITNLRAIGRLDLLTGPIRPYVLVGAGGMLMNFGDANDFSTGALTGGLGVSHPIGSNHFINVEGSLDVYTSRVEHYDLQGNPVYTGPETTETLKLLSINVGSRF